MKVAPTATTCAAGRTDYHLDFPGEALRRAATYESGPPGRTGDRPPTIYARVGPRLTGQARALQYWIFYVYNDFNNKHEGDWEMIQLDFDAPDPTAALG